jgi:hypothetical protein
LRYLKARFPHVDAWQVYANGKRDYITKDGIRVGHAVELLTTLA